MDTGSFVYDIETEDFYRDIAKDVEKRFYTSGYSRVYTYRKIDKEVEQKRCKGTKKCGVAERLNFDDYNTHLYHGKTLCREQMLFKNKKHKVYTVNKHKIALNRDDEKRLVEADEITTLARGYVSASGLMWTKDVFSGYKKAIEIFTQGV